MAMLKTLMSLAVITMLMNIAMAATNYTVGGPTGGWDASTNLQTWASSQTFSAGDNLVFQYNPNHDVVEVPKADYDSCQTTNQLQTYTGGNTVIPLTSPGKRYFICGTTGHCSQGMKVEIDTLAASVPPKASPAASPPTAAPPISPPAAAPPISAPAAALPISPPAAAPPISPPASPLVTPVPSPAPETEVQPPKTAAHPPAQSPMSVPTVSPPSPHKLPAGSPTSTPVVSSTESPATSPSLSRSSLPSPSSSATTINTLVGSTVGFFFAMVVLLLTF